MTTTTTPSSTEGVEASLTTMATMVPMIDVNDKSQLASKFLAGKINEIITYMATLQPNTSATVTRDRGPKSEREMSEDDAIRIMLGDLKDASHKSAAETLGLSYGQIYSARKGFTFKGIYKQMMNGNVAKATEPFTEEPTEPATKA